MKRSLFVNLLIVLALLFSQLGGLAHGISHTSGDRSGSEHSLPHDKYCDQCVAYAQIGGAVGSSPVEFAGKEVFDAPYVNDSNPFVSHAFVAFAARAPPYSI